MGETRFLRLSQPVVLDVPAPVRAIMPARHFILTDIDGADAFLRTAEALPSVVTGVPVTLSVGTGERPLEGVLLSSTPPDGLTVRLSDIPDRRDHPRIPLSVPVELEPLTGSRREPVRTTSVNVSQSGILVRSAYAIPTGCRAFTVIGVGVAASVMAITEIISCGIEPGGSAYLIRAPFCSIADEHRARLDVWMTEALKVAQSALA